MIAIEPHAQGVVLSIKAQPSGKRNGIRGEHDGALRISVTQPAERGKANRALLDVLADCLAVKRSQVELLSGASSSHKRCLIRGLSLDEVRRRLETVLHQPDGI